MKIERFKNKDECALAEVHAGEPFAVDGDVYIRTSSKLANILCVNLQNGQGSVFTANARVVNLRNKCKLVIDS